MIPLRDENPTRIVPFVNYGLVGLCVLAFLWQLTLGEHGGERAIFALGAIPAVLLGHAQLPPEFGGVPPALSILTSMFLHGGWMHLIGNMLFLWIFGDNIEEAMGRVRYLLFYVLCGVVAAFSQALPNPQSEVPMIGASGAISGVLGAYLMLFPHVRVLTLIPLGLATQLVRLPAIWVLLLWFGLQLLSNVFGGEGGIAFSAHIGGFVAGVVLIGLFKRRSVPFGFSRR
ncbi:MAG TPA: rhomboid family intramembrane serine protease [Steroidobacteraceae bacterium]|nr:rhomboid family intramembrane serine protease [Steroidobacteraceae bacterium]